MKHILSIYFLFYLYNSRPSDLRVERQVSGLWLHNYTFVQKPRSNYEMTGFARITVIISEESIVYLEYNLNIFLVLLSHFLPILVFYVTVFSHDVLNLKYSL